MAITSIAFLLAFLAGCFLALVRHPIYGLVTYVGVFYAHPPSRWWGASLPDLRWSLLAAAVTVVAILVSKPSKPMPSVQKTSAWVGLVLFSIWLAIQWVWAMSPMLHGEIVLLYAKYVLLFWMIWRCIETEAHLRLFLWSHFVGCAYLGWVVYTTYVGGRFESFGGPGIDEANAGTLQIVTGTLVGGALLLGSSWGQRIAVILLMPLIVNAMVATMSRSGFLGAFVGGLSFNLLVPRTHRKIVLVLSCLAVLLFVALTNPLYWSRINTIQAAGAEIEGVDTGSGRLRLIRAQWAMFRRHPLGCGYECTDILSPSYLDDRDMTAARSGDGTRARGSHNTLMTLLVETGVVGGVVYLLILSWTATTVLRLTRLLRRLQERQKLAILLPAIAASLAAIFIGDMFVDYLKFEARIWLLAALAVMVRMLEGSEPEADTMQTNYTVLSPATTEAPAKRV